MNRLLITLAAFAVSCAAADGDVAGQSQAITQDASLMTSSAKDGARQVPRFFVPALRRQQVDGLFARAHEEAEETTATAASAAQEDAAQPDLAAEPYVNGVGDPECVFTDLCGSAGGNYDGCVFGFCAWCQQWATCHFADGTINPTVIAPCAAGPCKKP